LSLVLIVVFLVVRDRSKRKVPSPTTTHNIPSLRPQPRKHPITNSLPPQMSQSEHAWQ
jgi:hypothetical protein